MSNNTRLFSQEIKEKEPGPVKCLGVQFENDEARRKYFTEQLRGKLKEPEFRKIEGFPIGSDEDILNLSDPPYYTACPNPWIGEFIVEWEAQKPAPPDGYQYHREPFAADVSEGKNDPIYNAHSYHTKVPHKAIMRYILHYTEPGDIVFDGFCGTGMTGVAAQMCGDREVVMSLGYQVKSDGTILRQETDEEGKTLWQAFSKLGSRRAVLNDLSPAATFIAYNYNTPVNVHTFESESKRILAEVEKEFGWMYATVHRDTRGKIPEREWLERLALVKPGPSVVQENPDLRFGKINYTVWSDVFVCPECSREVIFWEVAVDREAGSVKEEFPCPHCHASLTKRNMERAWVTKYDSAIKETVRQAKQVPVHINYSVSGKRNEKTPDAFDLALIDKVENSEIPYWFPTDRMMEGKETRRNDPVGITHVHHFYTKSSLFELSLIWEKCQKSGHRESKATLLSHTAASPYASKMRRFRADKKGGGPLAGTLYVGSLITPPNPVVTVGRNVQFIADGLRSIDQIVNSSIITAQSCENSIFWPENSLDYIFTDPPFGSNLNYSELNFLWESWLKVWTDNKPEAIENSVQGKGLNEYRKLMTTCFKEAYRVLKPGRWMTVEFSNTKASVWNSIQTALAEAGFIVANVSALDKKQGSFKAVNTPTAVKQDLVISAYKPNGGFEERFQKEAATEEGVWDFVRTHLKYLPVIKRQGFALQMVAERDPRILFDQMVSYYVRKDYPVPMGSPEFQKGLRQRYPERDGMFFLPEQVAEYDRKRMLMGGGPVNYEMWVKDEASAIEWLRHQIKEKPQTFQDIHPLFIQELGGWSKTEQALELSTLLAQNFLCYDGKGPVPEQIHAYLSSNWRDQRNLAKDDPTLVSKARDRWYVPDPNKVGDLEKLRERSLLKEFEEYKQTKKNLKVFRLEAVRAGFKKAWQERDYATIVNVADKIPNNVLEEDPKLLMWYDQAVTRMGDGNERRLS